MGSAAFSARSVRVQSSRTSITATPSATAKVRSRSEKRSPPPSASDPTSAPATTRLSLPAMASTWSRRASRCSTVNMDGRIVGECPIIRSMNTRIALLTREYPPEVYGGAGTHVEYLVPELRRLMQVTVHCWGAPREEAGVKSYRAWEELAEPKPEAAALQAMSIDLAMAAGAWGSDLAHSHTWYANLAGHMAKLMWSIPHVMTIHSLEPLRPWKAEQLGGGYALSLYCERTAIEAADAVIAVSRGVRDDVMRCYPAVDPARIHVIHNGIDPEIYSRQPSAETLARYEIDQKRPYAFFNGRIRDRRACRCCSPRPSSSSQGTSSSSPPAAQTRQ